MASPDLTLYIDASRGMFVQGPATMQELNAPDFIQGQEISVQAQFLALTGNGLAPYVNIDPTGWTLNFGLGYINAAGQKALIALSSTSATTAISGISAQTALAFTLNLNTSAASALVLSVPSAPVWMEAAWSIQSAQTGYANKAQILAEIDTGFVSVGLPAPT